jgi:hypothetical protein
MTLTFSLQEHWPEKLLCFKRKRLASIFGDQIGLQVVASFSQPGAIEVINLGRGKTQKKMKQNSQGKEDPSLNWMYFSERRK